MTEPTDHRTEAEGWLGSAEDRINLARPKYVTACALLAIAHDLHRIADALETPPEHEHAWTGANSTAGFLLVCSRCGATRRDAIADDQPGPGNVEADFTEDGQIIQVAINPTEQPERQCRWADRCQLMEGHQGRHAVYVSGSTPEPA